MDYAGVLGLAGVLVMARGVRAGLGFEGRGQCGYFDAEAKEHFSDLVEEVRSEQKETRNGDGEEHKLVNGGKSSKKKAKTEE